MRPRPVLRTIAHGALVAMLAAALTQAVETMPAQTQTTPTPTPCEVRRINLADPALADHTIGCAAADATATAYIMVTVTPCDPWGGEHKTPIAGWSGRLVAPCGVVAHNATWIAIDATRTAGIIDGSYYGLHWSNSAPNWTPTIFTYGTVPAAELTAYPLTLTARPQETPIGWCLDGDRWVTDCGGRP